MSAQRNISRALHDLADKRKIPLNMILEITHRCNQRCIHCYLPETRGRKPPSRRNELSSLEWGRVLEELAEAGTMFMVFSGGEALLREDFNAILRRARELGFSIEIFTNATMVTAETARFLAEMNVSNVGVSCYGPNASAHDRITGVKGSFERTLRGVKLLRRAGLPVKLKVPLMRLNARCYENLIALARSLGIRWQFDPLISPGNDGADIPSRLAIDERELCALYRDERLMPRETLLRARHPSPDEPVCSAGRTFGAITPYGDVLPCIQWLVPAGNVRFKPFGEIWRKGAVLIKARSTLWKDVKPCPDCGCSHYTHCPGLSRLERGDANIPCTKSCRLARAVRQIQGERQRLPPSTLPRTRTWSTTTAR